VTAALVAEADEQPVIAAAGRRLPHRDGAVPVVRPRDVEPALRDHVTGLRLVDVDRLNQVVTARTDVADVDEPAAVQLTLEADVPLLRARRVARIARVNRIADA